ncbi:Hint domain-containing protein, partial [Kitasatospora sp. NPDC015120]|uniref:Hint domain-containing protein n=1 Tax=Kitasatospora sp. NPDC015120 TaxID=3364023 RepID=UPI0036F47F18
SPYDYCTGDPVNCTDLDGNWGMPKWLKKTVQVVAVVAEVVATVVPGPIGAVAAAVSSVSYAATGNWEKAAEMAVTAVAATVGAGPVVKAAAAAVKSTRAATRVERAASAARNVSRRPGPTACTIPNSFAPDTPVLMADGQHWPIGEVHPGDLVAATDPETGETQAEPVLDVIVGYGSKHLVDIFTNLGSNAAPLRATAGHPVWVVDRGWIDAVAVRPGDLLQSPDGSTPVVTEVDDLGEVPDQIVFNLNVGNRHTYAVQVADSDAVVHNCSKPVLTQHQYDTHIQPRHVSRDTFQNKSKFKTQAPLKVQRIIRTTLRKGEKQPNTGGRPGNIYIHPFNRTVGTGGQRRVKVVVGPNGRVITAYPIR